MTSKLLKVTLAVFFLILFLYTGLYFGSQIERNDHKASEIKLETVQTIAIVNLDEGIILEDTPIYYSRDFLLYPSDNFASTGIEDARQGINQGRYAAYIIIPASFSRSIASINGNPQKTTLEYALNPNLEDYTKIEIITDIQEFHLLLNTNIAYVYVSSILSEFHNSQDASAIVLRNDKTELTRISSIESEKLLHELAYSDLETLDYNLEDVDINGEFSESEQLMEDLETGILFNLSQGVDEFQRIKGYNDIFQDSSYELFDLLRNISPGQTLSGELVYENGLDELEQAIDVFNTEQSLKRARISDFIFDATSQFRDESQEYLSLRTPHLQDEIDLQFANRLTQMQEEADEALWAIQQDNLAVIQAELEIMEQERAEEDELIQHYIDDKLEQILVDLKVAYEEEANQQLWAILEDLGVATSSQATYQTATPSNLYEIVLATASDVRIDIDESGVARGVISGRLFALKTAVSGLLENKNPLTDVWILLQSLRLIVPDDFFMLPLLDRLLFDALAVQVEEIYLMSIDLIRDILQDEVIGRIARENENQKTDVEVMMDRLKANMDDYENSIEGFDPYLYIHIGDISRTLNEVNRNISQVDHIVYEKTSKDRSFVDQVYDLITQNTDTLQSDMEKTNEQTLTNIIQTVESIQTAREETNQQNTYLLEDFTRKLSYTRVGSIGNKEAYDFIVNPVTMIGREEEKRPLFQWESELEKYLFSGALLLAIAAGSIMATTSFWILQRSKNKSNNSL